MRKRERERERERERDYKQVPIGYIVIINIIKIFFYIREKRDI